MLGARETFDNRLHRIKRTGRRTKKAKKSFEPVIGPDGLIIVRHRKRGPSVPIRGLIYLACGFILFKAIALTQFGTDSYNERVNAMQNGTVLEQAGAWVMQTDRVTLWVADKIRPLLR